ncbi:MAG: Lrp/AsnC family transcriptional regulator, partial [Lawsonibacter sp.]|nr:Lrp/AsnC family transcriptional regulator [Lawsonibacter sp.]
LVAVFPEKYGQFCKFCEDTPAITAHHHLVGKLNALLRFAVADTRQLDTLLASIKQYGDSQTSVELGACFEQKDVPLPK